jgi:hypothetical protein
VNEFAILRADEAFARAFIDPAHTRRDYGAGHKARLAEVHDFSHLVAGGDATATGVCAPRVADALTARDPR